MANKKDQQVATSDFNLERLTTKELGQHVHASSLMGSNVAIFGRRGSGKTEICKQEIANAGFQEIYLNLSVYERVDLGGYPDVMNGNRKKNFVDFLLPQFYEPMIEGKKKVVLLLDEVDKADPSLWAPLLELVQFKSINGRELPNLQACLMTGNLISEGGARPSLPLLDRAEKYLVEADVGSWMDWAGKVGKIHPSIVSYLHDNPADLFGAVDPDERYADPSPRGWTGASAILYAGEQNNASAELLNMKVAGRVGKQAGIKYAHYYEHYQTLLPLVEKLFEGKNIDKDYAKLPPTKKLVAGIIIGTRLANKLDETKPGTKEADMPKCVSWVGRFFKEAPPEDAFVVIRNQIQIKRLAEHDLDEHSDWREIVDDINKKLGMGR